MQTFDASAPQTWAPAWLLNTDAPFRNTYVHMAPLTTYEQTVALGMRAMELNQNASPRVYAHPDQSSLDIARQEMRAGMLPPMSVLRYLPDGTFIRKSVNDALRLRRV